MKLKENMVVNCKNKDDARVFLDECKKQGFDDPYYYEYTDWEYFKEDTCYKIYNKNGIRYASKSFYISEGHKIINFDDLFKTESKFKVGDKVKEDKMSKCKVYEMPDYVRDEVKKVIINNRTVVVILKSGHKGVATCSPEDKFIESVGYQIALLRARINKKEDELKRKKQVLSRITKNPKLLDDFFIV